MTSFADDLLWVLGELLRPSTWLFMLKVALIVSPLVALQALLLYLTSP